MELVDFAGCLKASPILSVTVVLTVAVIFVNGWTDAPNAIATCISTRSLKPRTAVLTASVMNFFGICVMTAITPRVAFTIENMVDFGTSGQRERYSLVALCAALFAIVIWAVAAWYFGIPTSESHALIAGLSGAALAMSGTDGINFGEWRKVLSGLAVSAVLGFFGGYVLSALTSVLFRRSDRVKARSFFKTAQIFGGAAMAFMHGAQDGQKFMGVFLLAISLSGNTTSETVPLWLMLMCSAVMCLGTSVGGYRIIKAVGTDMVRLERYQGFASDISGALCLLFASLTGLPVSTTHVKTASVMGAGASRGFRRVKWSAAGEMLLAWVLTFPGCGILGFLTAKLFLSIF